MQHLPKREVTRAGWGGNIPAGWEDGVGRGKRRKNYILRELGEIVVVEVEKAGERDKDEERWDDDESTPRH